MRWIGRTAVVLCAAWALSPPVLASGEKPAVVEVGNPLPIFNGGFSPKALPRKLPAPLTMDLSLATHATLGAHQPALGKVDLEIDRHVRFDAKGLAVCRAGKTDEPPVSQRCQDAIVGRGSMEVAVEFPEQPPFLVRSRLLAFNGGVKAGKTIIFIVSNLTEPVNSTIVSRVEVGGVDDGRFGTAWEEDFPSIAGGAGSVVDFSLVVDRSYRDEGAEKSYLLGRCTDGKLEMHGTTAFADGTTQSDTVVRACTPKG